MLITELRGHEGEVNALDCHPYNLNVLLSGDADGRLLIWDIIEGEVTKSFLDLNEGRGLGAVFDARWNSSGSTIAATDSDGHLSIYGIGTTNNFTV